MKSIKIGRTTHQIKPGDYVLYNGACHQFIAGDGRTLQAKGWSTYSNLLIPKTRLKEIDFKNMKKKETGNKKDKTLLIKWYF